MNTELLTRLVRIQTELNAIMMELASSASPSTTAPSATDDKKGPGRPRKAKKERDPNKPKKVLSPEHLAKLKEGRERRAAEKAAAASESSDDVKSVTTAASSDTEEGEVKDEPSIPPAPKKARGRPRKDVQPIPAPDFSSAASESE